MNELITRVREATGLDDATAQTAIDMCSGSCLTTRRKQCGGVCRQNTRRSSSMEAAAATGDAGVTRRLGR